LFDCDSFGVCAATALQFQTNEMASYGTDGSVDLYTDRGTDIDFQALATTDDRETKSMDLYLDIGDADLLEHRIHVTMHKCGEWPRSAPPSQPRSTDPDCPANIAGDQDCCGTVGAPEIASWRGSLPVNTPELIEGDYHVWARLFDTRNVNTTTPDIFDMVTLHVTSLEDTCVPACIKLNSLQPASNIPGNCFYNEADATRNVLPAPRDRLSFGLGHGETIRPYIQATQPGFYTDAMGNDIPTIQPNANYPIVDQNLLLRKVTYQTCIDTDFGTVYGPEVALPYPYYMALDTLFTNTGCSQATGCDQDVALRAYDRIGTVNGTAFHLVTDTSRPAFLIYRPDTTYRDVPFQFTVLVHDRIDTEVSLHIDHYERTTSFDNRSTAATPVPSGNVSVSNAPWLKLTACGIAETRCDVGQLDVVRIPRLANTTMYDIGGPHDRSAACDYLFDGDGDGRLDTVFDGRALRVKGHLLATESAAGGYNDYVLDVDGDGQLTPGEPLVPMTPTGTAVNAGRCVQAFPSEAVRAFLMTSETQVFSYTLVRNTLGSAPYRVAIRDLVFNNDADPSSTFSYPVGCVTACRQATSTLIGRFDTAIPFVDASVTDLNVTAVGVLPGDPVWLNATVEEHSPQLPEPSSPLVFGVSEKQVFLQILNGTRMCPAVTNTTVPLQAGFTKCYSLFPPAFQGQCAILCQIFQLPLEPQTQGCPAPPDVVHMFNVCVERPDLAIPVETRDHELRLPYAPGIHTVAGFVGLAGAANDTTLANNVRFVDFEVFLGRVVSGTMDASGHATNGKEYLIRADSRGLPVLTGGAVKLGPSGAIVDRYDLTFKQDPSLRYEFTPDGGKTTLYWEPSQRQSVDPAICGYNDTVTASCMRPITVIPTSRGSTSTTTKASPDVALALPVAVVALAALALRRRR
ncbi:MAG: hypothetical protein LC620_01425, partial [Halobacteriales archaeon]|nr:hypothetical protein [Halobacteriales archaeon]